MSRTAPLWPIPRVIAHRCGGAGLAPENTLAGLRIASALGIRAVEFDVMLSSDGTPWLIHDETLDRTTNGTGKVCETPDRVLQTLDAGAYQHKSFIGEPLPSFADAARVCRALGLLANVEIKPAAGFEARTGEVVAQAILELWNGAPLPLVSSFSPEALAAARAVSPNLPIGYLWDRPAPDWLDRLKALDGFSLHCAASEVDDATLELAQNESIPVLCWTVNDRERAEALLARGVAAVITDRVDRMLGL